jgi:hypothetical protein
MIKKKHIPGGSSLDGLENHGKTRKISTGYFMGISWNMVINYMAFKAVSRSINWMEDIQPTIGDIMGI